MNVEGAMPVFPASFQRSDFKMGMSLLCCEMWDWIGRYSHESCPGIADIPPLSAACGWVTALLAAWKPMPADTHMHLAWQIVIKNPVLGLDIQVKMKKTSCEYVERLSLRKRCMKRVGACFKRGRGPCLCGTRWASVACSATAEWPWLLLVDFLENKHKDWSQHCPESSGETSNCAAAGAPRSLFPWLMLVLWGWVSPRWSRESAADSFLCGWLFLRVWNVWNDHIFSQRPQGNALFTTLPPDGV